MGQKLEGAEHTFLKTSRKLKNENNSCYQHAIENKIFKWYFLFLKFSTFKLNHWI